MERVEEGRGKWQVRNRVGEGRGGERELGSEMESERWQRGREESGK